MAQKTILPVFFLIFMHIVVLKAQTDKTFWFVAPEVTQDVNDYDRPTAFKISTFDKPATVKISQPANPLFIPQIISIPAKESGLVQFPPNLDFLENKPPNAILDKGILIESTEDITVYYEVISGFNSNPEIFALKGRNALGLEFYIPFQNLLDNSSDYSPQPYSAFDIVATEDNTVVNIVPTKDIVGHVAGVPFSITLNKGQTYSGASQSTSGINHPTGTHVTANKPISITMKDDLLWGTPLFDGFCRDLMGDQLVPVEKLGLKHILYKGNANNNEMAFVVATKAGTNVSLDGQLIGTINAGQSLNLPIPFGPHLIEVSKPAYVFHLSGINCEVAGALLPSIECSGSFVVRFVRTVDDDFDLILTTRNGNQNGFLINGQSNVISPFNFQIVPGSNNEYVAAKISMSTFTIPTGFSSAIENTKGVFQMGFLNGGAVTGGRYGFFSDFGKEIKIQDTLKFCSGSSVNWHGLTISNEGNYSKLVSGINGCDTLFYGYAKFNDFNYASKVISSCPGNPILLNGQVYNESTTVTDTLSGQNSCDTIYSYLLSFLPFNQKQKTVQFCEGGSITLNGKTYFQPGAYLDTLKSFIACDTIITYALSYFPKNTSQQTVDFCPGGTVSINGKLYNQPGVVVDTLLSAAQCDSIVTYQLSFLPYQQKYQTVEICIGDSYTINGTTYTENATVTDTIPSFSTCDTIKTYQLQFLPNLTQQRTLAFCPGTSITIQGKIYTQPGTILDTLSSLLQCDTVRTTFLTFTESPRIQRNILLCRGEKVRINGMVYDSNAVVLDTIRTPDNCDTIRVNTIVLDDLPPTDFPKDTFLCPGTVLTLSNPFVDPNNGTPYQPNFSFAQPGVYAFSGRNANFCPESVQITVQTCCNEKGIYVPNIFSPNDDGENDRFCVFPVEACSNYQLQVYDRWGNLLFTGLDAANCWDGTFRDKMVPPGVYTWFLSFFAQDQGDRAVLKGSVTVIR